MRHESRNAYQLARADSAEQIAAVDAEDERLQSEGPDFTGYHVGSDFREPPAHNLTREDRSKILHRFDGIRAGLYRHCRSKRGQAVSRNYRDVLGVLLSFAVKRSKVFPSLDTIARMAMCSPSTVLRAIAWLSLYGFLRQAPTHRKEAGATRPARRSNIERLRAALPERIGRARGQHLQHFA